MPPGRGERSREVPGKYGRFRLPLLLMLSPCIPVGLRRPDFHKRNVRHRGYAFYRSQPASGMSHTLSEYQDIQRKLPPLLRPIVRNMCLPAVQRAAATLLLLRMLKRSFSTRPSRILQKNPFRR